MQYLLTPGAPGNGKLKNSGREFPKPKPSISPSRAIYSGVDRLGHVAARGSQIDAYDRRGNLVGSFSNIITAVDALGGAAAVRR